MKLTTRIALLGALLLAPAAALAQVQTPVYCNASTSTACNTASNPGNGTQGDPAWLAFGKVNSWGTQLGLFANDPANEVLATPNGSTGIPSLRALVSADLPAALSTVTSVNGSSIPATAGTLFGSSGAFTVGDCLEVASASPLEAKDAGAACGSGSGMVYPSAGIPDSTGTAWGTSYATVGTGSVVLQGVDIETAGNTLTPDCAYSMDKVTATTYLIQAPTQSAPTTASTGGSLAGNTYYYVVTAETSVGQTTASGQQAITSDTDSPPTNGALTSTSGGTLAATTDYVRSTWVTASGQTTGATETSLAVAADYVLNVAAPSSPPANATGWNVYVSTTTGTETLQNSSPIGTTTAWVEPTTGLVTGASLPSSNTAWLTATNENVISWAEVTGATGYVVYRSTTPSDFTNATSYTVSGGTTVTFTDTGATGTTATPPTTNTTGAFTIDAPASCTPTDGQKLEIKIISPAGGIVSYDWPSAILGSTQLALPTTSAGAGLEDYFQLQYDADLTDWVMLSYNQGF